MRQFALIGENNIDIFWMLIHRNIRGIIADILMPYYSDAGNAEYIANIAENKLIQNPQYEIN